jgi:2'-5' RNA ligase
MPVIFEHYIDQFIELMGPDRTVAPGEMNRYFGKPLSRVLIKKLENRCEAKEYFSPKAWSMALVTDLSENEKSGAVKKHLTWKFFGDCKEKLLSTLSSSMKEMERKKIRTFDKYANMEITFSGLDYFTYSDGKRGIIHLKPDPSAIPILNEIRNSLVKAFGMPEEEDFKPHVTVARIKNIRDFTGDGFLKMKQEWQDLKFILKPDHFILKRHLDNIDNQPVFGIRLIH